MSSFWRIPSLSLLLALLALAGCPSLSTLGGANTVPRGDWQLGAALELAGARDDVYDWKAALPQLELTVRRGFTDDLDAGLKLYIGGAELGAKWRFRRGCWAMAIAPSFGYLRPGEDELTSEAEYLFLHLPYLVTHPLSSRWKLSFGAKLLYDARWPRNGGFASGLHAGTFINFDWHWGAHGRWHLLPELNLYRTLTGDEPFHGAAYQLGLAVLLDL